MGKVSYLPIDFIKAEIKGVSVDFLLNNENLDFNSKLNLKTGEISNDKIAYYHNFKIIIYGSKRIWLSGSFHVLSNEGKHNYNDFSYCGFLRVLYLLKSDLGISPSNLYIICLEWGFNLDINLNCRKVLDRLIQHKSINKTVGIDNKLEGKYVQFKHSNFILKVYDKGTQFSLDKSILRIEIKQTNWSKYRELGIMTLNDFMKNEKGMFFNELIHQWNSVIVYDVGIGVDDRYLKYSTNLYWDELRSSKSRKSFKYHKDKLRLLNESIGLNIQKIIETAIIKKGNELQVYAG